MKTENLADRLHFPCLAFFSACPGKLEMGWRAPQHTKSELHYTFYSFADTEEGILQSGLQLPSLLILTGGRPLYLTTFLCSVSSISTFALSYFLKSVYSWSGEPHCPGYFCPVHSRHCLPVPAPRVPSSHTTAQIFSGSLPRLHYYTLSLLHPSIKCDTGVIFSSTKSRFHSQIIKQVTTVFIHLYIQATLSRGQVM